MATSTAILTKPMQKRGTTYIAVRWAFWIEVLVFFGLTGLFVAWSYANIDWNGYGFISLLPQLIIAALPAGFIAGLMTRHAGKGTFPSLILAIFTSIILFLLYLIDLLFNNLDQLGLVGSLYAFDPMIYPEVVQDGGLNQLVWNLPSFVVAICAAPMGVLGGAIGKKYLKIPKGQQLGAKEQLEKFLDTFKKPLFLLIFLVVWTPLIIPLFSMDDSVQKEYSAWNYGGPGTSRFRSEIEAAGYTDTISSVGSYSLLSRIDEPFVLVVMGPNRFYNLVSDIPFLMKFIRNNGSLLVAHEQGSTDWLLFNMFLSASIENRTFPLTFFMDGVLRDNASYHMRNDFPVIDSTNIVSHAVTAGVSKLVMNRASGLMLLPGMEGAFGWNILATSTNAYSWVDKDDDGKYSREKDNFDPYQLGIPMILFQPLKAMGISFPDGLPQGGLPIPVVGATEMGPTGSRVVITADASMFSNEMIDLGGFDNKRFAINCIDWLTRGNKSMKVVFDESHLRPVGIQDTSASAVYGQVLDYVGFMSSNWLLAPFYPFLALKLLRRWLPKSEEQKRKEQERKRKRDEAKAKALQRREKVQRQRVGRIVFEKGSAKDGAGGKDVKEKKQKTLAQKRAERKMQGMLKKSTIFAQKLAWYLEQPDFNKALDLLYKRVKRLAGKKLGEAVDDKGIIAAIVDRNPQVEQRRLETFFRQMKRITAKPGSGRLRITRPETLEKLYYEIITVAEYLEKI